MDVLCQFQADVLGVPVRRPAVQETTALGAAYLAGIAEGVWATPAEAASAWREEASFTPRRTRRSCGILLDTWHRAWSRTQRVERGPSAEARRSSADVDQRRARGRQRRLPVRVVFVASARSDRSSSWARIRPRRVEGDRAQHVERGRHLVGPALARRTTGPSPTRTARRGRRPPSSAAGAAGRRRAPAMSTLTPASSMRTVRSSRPALGATNEPSSSRTSRPTSTSSPTRRRGCVPEQRVHVGERHRLAVVVAPARAQHLVDAEPVGHRSVRAGADQILDRLELEPALLQLGDELQPLDVLLGVPRLASVAARLRQHALRLVVADRAAAHAAARRELVEARAPSTGVGVGVRRRRRAATASHRGQSATL